MSGLFDVLDLRINNNNDLATKAMEESGAAMDFVEEHRLSSFHDGVPQLIADALTVQTLTTQLTQMRSDKLRLGRIIDGHTLAPPSPEDESAWVELLDDIEVTCDRLMRLGGSHRLCL